MVAGTGEGAVGFWPLEERMAPGELGGLMRAGVQGLGGWGYQKRGGMADTSGRLPSSLLTYILRPQPRVTRPS